MESSRSPSSLVLTVRIHAFDEFSPVPPLHNCGGAILDNYEEQALLQPCDL